MADSLVSARADLVAYGNALEECLDRLDWTQAELAHRLTPHVRTPSVFVCRLVHGQIVPTPQQVRAVADVLDSVGERVAILSTGRNRLVRTPTPARHTDPDTSSEAANTIPPSTTIHRAVLGLLNECPLAHHEVAVEYGSEFDRSRFPLCSGQRLRTATSELVHAGLVQKSGHKVKNARGNPCVVWAITPAGRQHLQDTHD